MSVIFNDNVAYLAGPQSTVYFAENNGFAASGPGTVVPIKKLTTSLDIAPWGEDNRFPQNIERTMAAFGAGKAALDWKARALWGNGIMPVTIEGYEPDGKTEILKPLDRIKYKEVYEFIESRKFFRFYLEFLQDWTWYANCFPELILSNDGSMITGLVHQESNDCRFRQMNESGVIDTVYISKLWGMARDQFVRFNKDKSFSGLMENPANISQADNKFIKKLRALDMYNPLADLAKAVAELKNKSYKSVILPVNYPSPNKTYYQLASWDAARQAGWIDIATKIPALIKATFNNAFNIKYHIEIPEKYFEKRLGTEAWQKLNVEDKRKERKKLLDEMNEFLKGTDKAHAALVSFFDVNDHSGTELNRVKITVLENKNNLDKDLLISASANSEFYFAAQLNPDMLGASIPGGAYGGNKGGSNIREGKLVYDSMLHLERQVTLEPLYLVRDYNKWGSEIQFRYRDIVLTTLDKGKGTEKVVS